MLKDVFQLNFMIGVMEIASVSLGIFSITHSVSVCGSRLVVSDSL